MYGWLYCPAVHAAVYVFLLGAITLVAQEPKREPPTPSKPDVAKSISSGIVSFSARVEAGPDSTVLHIDWSGQEPESLLVVSVERDTGEPAEVFPAEIELGKEIVFVRRVADRGDTSIQLPNDSISEFLRCRRARIRVFLTQGVGIDFVRENPDVKVGGKLIYRTDQVRPADASPEFRIIGAKSDVPRFTLACPKIKLWSIDAAEDKDLLAVIDCDHQQAFLQLSVTFGGGDAP